MLNWICRASSLVYAELFDLMFRIDFAEGKGEFSTLAKWCAPIRAGLTYINKKAQHFVLSFELLRSGRDSNPLYSLFFT